MGVQYRCDVDMEDPLSNAPVAWGEDSARWAAQWVLSRDGAGFPDWRRLSTAHWTLAHGPAMPAGRLTDARGVQVGLMLGVGVDAEGVCRSRVGVLPFDAARPDFADRFEAWATGMGGRYVLILDHGGRQRVYTDPVADCGVVYDAGTERVAASLMLAIDRTLRPNPLFDHEIVRTGRRAYILGWTHDATARRLPANNRLNLTDFSLTRHWPHPEAAFPPSETPDDEVDMIIERLGQTIAALTRAHDCVLPLSAGRDSRNLLGCARASHGRLKYAFTHEYTRAHLGWGRTKAFMRRSWTIRKLAAEMADRFNIPHRTVAMAPQADTVAGYDRLVGHIPNPVQAQLLDGLNAEPAGRISLMGNVMEMLRANQWKKINEPGRPNRVFALRRLLRNPDRRPEIEEAYKTWMRSIGRSRDRHLFEIQFVEHWLPNTLGPKHYAMTSLFVVNPFADRALIEASLRLPLSMRMADEINRKILARTAPELLDLPSF